jgi:hypothetical protein
LLEQTLEEEKKADQKLSQLAEEINPQAAQAEGDEATSTKSREGRNAGTKPKRAA